MMLLADDEAVDRDAEEPEQREPKDHGRDTCKRGVLAMMGQHHVSGLGAARHGKRSSHPDVVVAPKRRSPWQGRFPLKRGVRSIVERRRVEGLLQRITNFDRCRGAVNTVGQDEQQVVSDQSSFSLGKAIR